MAKTKLSGGCMDKDSLVNFRRDKVVGEVLCPWDCGSNKFSLFETDTGFLQFVCLKCRKAVVMPFRRLNNG